MSERLGSLYHWSPIDRRDAIRERGLVPGSRSTVASGELGYVCLAPSPRHAWLLSGDLEWTSEVEEWDLWQIQLADSDDVRVRPHWGWTIQEVAVHNAIPPDRVWWVGARQPWLTAS
jgi:hypothetical protein